MFIEVADLNETVSNAVSPIKVYVPQVPVLDILLDICASLLNKT